MVTERVTVQIESSVEAKRLWNALVVDGHNLLAKQLPEICSGVTFLHGDGGVGSIKQINFSTTANRPGSSYVRERVDELDEDNFVYRFSHVKGGELVNKLVSAQFQLKIMRKIRASTRRTLLFLTTKDKWSR
ncbi:hypothetical protein KI387_032398 [Taxus chinensis]|uniref:Bet v I/Major latex protein domain-containing protein n=1 Tax=Taxus chinensis TaxID=29808 RepID=A0AA38F3W8_TAXCH|nr:hypothetical protein KI387_032398 [Taxus chinensis]